MASARAAAVRKASSVLTAALLGKGLFGNTVRTMAFSVGILVINVMTGVITARLLGPEGRGVQMAIILWPQFLAFTTTLGLHASLLYHVKKDPGNEGAFYHSSVLMTLLTGSAGIVIGLLALPLWMADQSHASITASLSFLAVIPFMHLFFLHNALFRAREEFSLFNRMRYMSPLITLFLLLAFMTMGVLTPYMAALAYMLPYLPVSLFAMIRSLRLYRPRFPAIKRVSGSIFRYGLGSYGIDLLGNLILYMDQIILVGLLINAPSALGLYVVAVSLSRMINVFSTSIIMVLFPKASGLPEQEAALLSLRVFKISTLLALLVSGVVMLAAPLVIGILYGKAFLASIPVFRLLLLDVVIGGAALVLGQAFMAAGKPAIVSISQAIGLVIIVPLLFYLVPQYGIIGAGVGLLVASVARLIYMLVCFEKKFKFGYAALWLSTSDLVWFKGLLSNRKLRNEGSVEV